MQINNSNACSNTTNKKILKMNSSLMMLSVIVFLSVIASLNDELDSL